MSGSGAKRALTAAEAYSLLLHVRYPLEIYETSSPGDLFRGLFLERGGIMVSVGTKGDIRMPIAAAKIFGCSVFVFESDAVVRDAGLRIARTERVDHLIAFYPLDTSNIDFLKKSLTKPGISSSLVTHFCGVAMETLNQFEGTVTKLLQLGCRVVTENVHFDTFTNYDVSAGYRFLRKKQHTVETVLSGQEYSSSIAKLLGRQRDASARAAAKEAVDKPCLTGRAVGLVFDDRMTLHAPPVDEKSEIETRNMRRGPTGIRCIIWDVLYYLFSYARHPCIERGLVLSSTSQMVTPIPTQCPTDSFYVTDPNRAPESKVHIICLWCIPTRRDSKQFLPRCFAHLSVQNRLQAEGNRRASFWPWVGIGNISQCLFDMIHPVATTPEQYERIFSCAPTHRQHGIGRAILFACIEKFAWYKPDLCFVTRSIPDISIDHYWCVKFERLQKLQTGYNSFRVFEI